MNSNYFIDIRAKIGHIPIFYPVIGLVIYKDGKVLLQKRSDDDTWAIHGGGIEPGEKYVDALYREIKEEINIEPINPDLFGIYSGKDLYHIYPNGDEVYLLNHIFICEEYNGTISFNDGEVKEIKWFDIDNLPNNIFHVDKNILDDIKRYFENNRKIIIN